MKLHLAAVAEAVPLVPTPASTRTTAVATSSRFDAIRFWQRSLARRTLRAGYHLLRLGPAAVLGILAIAAAVVLGIMAVPAANTSKQLSARIAHAHPDPTLAVSTADAAAAKLLAAMPRRTQMPQVIGRILAQARGTGVALDSGHYVYIAPKAGEIGRYELEFPLKAAYPDVRAFIDRTLLALPAAGVDKLRIERKAVGENTVSADVRFVVFVHGE